MVRVEDICPLHGVLELPHVSRPAVGAHRLQRVVLEPRDQPALDPAHLFQEVIDQERDVVLALPQGRHLDRHHVQPIVQVLPEPLLPDLLLQKSVGYDPNPDQDHSTLLPGLQSEGAT